MQHLPEIQRMQFTCIIAPITVKRAPFPCFYAIVRACRNALQTTTYSHKQSTNPNKLQAQRQNTNLYHLIPTTNYQVPAQKALTLSTIHVLEDMHQLQGKKGLPPPSSLLRKAGQGAGGIYGPRARRTRHAYSLQKTQIYGTLA